MENIIHNYFFEAYDRTNNVCLGMVRYRTSFNICKTIYEKYYNKSILDIIVTESYDLYGVDLKEILQDINPYIISKLVEVCNNDLSNENIEVRQVTSFDYRNYDKEYDNECKFIDYIVSEKAKEDKQTIITEEILKTAGFENTTKDYERELWEDVDDYSTWHYATDKEDGVSYINIDFSKGITNNCAKWGVHFDNNACCTIGSADISTIWQFNTLMEVFGSKFRL